MAGCAARMRAPIRVFERRTHIQQGLADPGAIGLPLACESQWMWQAEETGPRMSTKSPTIADLELQGFVGFYVTCADPMCRYSTPIRFESLRLNPSTPFSAVRKMRRLECAACGSLEVSIMPEQREYKAS